MKGPSFIALHKLFDEVAGTAEEGVDLIAERVVQLGGIAEGTVHVAGQRSTLGEYPLKIGSGKDHVEALSNALAAFGFAIERHRQTTVVCRSPFARQLILLTE